MVLAAGAPGIQPLLELGRCGAGHTERVPFSVFL